MVKIIGSGAMAWPQLAALPLTRSVTLSEALHPERRLPPEHSEDDTKVPPSQCVVRMKQIAFSPSFLGLSLEELHRAVEVRNSCPMALSHPSTNSKSAVRVGSLGVHVGILTWSLPSAFYSPCCDFSN